jgi:hypothetical protein
VVADYGSYQVYSVETVDVELLAASKIELRDEFNLVRLNAAVLDTTRAETKTLRKAVGSFTGKRMHLVQFVGAVQPAWAEQLEGLGVQIVAYVPFNAYLVYGDATSLSRVQQFASTASHVQWDGAYLNDYKIHPTARTKDANGNPRQIGADMFAVQLVSDPEANALTTQLLDQLKTGEVKRRNTVLNYENVIVPLDAASVELVAAQPDVVSIRPYFERKKFCERQDMIVSGNLAGNSPSGPGYLGWLASKGFKQSQFTASGFAMDMTDSGLDNGTASPNHPGLFLQGATNNASRVIYNRVEGFPNPGSTLRGCDGHGTLNSHIVMGYDDTAGFPHADGSGFHFGLGVCPFVKIGSSVIFDPDFFTFPTYANLQSRAYRDGARVSNNSWGANVFGDYDSDSQEYDALVRDAQPRNSSVPANGNQEMIIVFAAGNAGPGRSTVGSPGTGKNLITVGAAENVQAFGGFDGCFTSDGEADSANDMSSFSSRGPCIDGRHKPDISAPGTHVSGGVAQEDNPDVLGTADACFTNNAGGICGGVITGGGRNLFFPDGQQLFSASTGTSHAAPGVAGGCGLIRQWFINTFGVPASPAMTKAFLMSSARYLTGSFANDSLWSDIQGMGEMNLGMAFDGVARGLRDQLPEDMFTASGQVRSFVGRVSDPSLPFRVTVAWTDAPGNTTGDAFNNNIDLVVDINGKSYKGNVFSGSTSVVGGAADQRNNVESVFLPAGTTGTFTITVRAANINSDGVPNNSTPLDQDFALVAYNVVLGTPPTITDIQPTNTIVLVGMPASFSVTATGDAPLQYQWLKGSNRVAQATNATLSFAAAQLADNGIYTVVVSNRIGSAQSSNVRLTVVSSVPLPFALNNSNLTWTTDSATPWFGQTNSSHDTVSSARSWFIGDGQSSTLRSQVTGPGTLTFWWKLSSQTNSDVLTFRSFGTSGVTNIASISGEVDWRLQTVYIPGGVERLEWSYSKNSSGSAGLDTAWLDQVSYTVGATPPAIGVQPASKIVTAGSRVTLTVSAAGTPPLRYQWRLVDRDIPGATGPTLVFPSVVPGDSGIYSVAVLNNYGSIVSDPAVLTVVPVLNSGNNDFAQGPAPLNSIGAIAISAGEWHSLALRPDGRVVAWGNNWDGQCDVPQDLTNAVAIAGGGYHSLAVRAGGTVVGWGSDDSSQISPPAGLANVKAVAAGVWHSVALLKTGTVVAWGDNSWDQARVPTGLNNVKAIAAAGNHTLALKTDGTIVGWGQNTGPDGLYVGQSTVPWNATNIVAISAGEYHSLAVRADGTLLVWGDNSQGQSQAPALTGVVAAAGGGGTQPSLERRWHSRGMGE